MTDRTAQIEIIAVKLMGWHKGKERPGCFTPWFWGGPGGKNIATAYWNPYTNAADLETVKKRVVELGCKYTLRYTGDIFWAEVGKVHSHIVFYGSADTEADAFLEAVLQLQGVQGE